MPINANASLIASKTRPFVIGRISRLPSPPMGRPQERLIDTSSFNLQTDLPGRFAEPKHYFSGKHHLYGYKIEAAVSPDGRCVAMSTADPGSLHDLTIMNSRKHVHLANLGKSASESLVPDHGEQAALHRGSWACLVDMGYIGISHSLRGIHPKRRPAHGSLDASDLERNANVSSDRVIVENFFGRVWCSPSGAYPAPRTRGPSETTLRSSALRLR
ncbi:hypothetical protein H257_15413 [Aphanomyces astaci]|uniref:DDE Tnp4 domain-containing protein n=1 Tax=Aphanomyces astaci TaxID=112090 RepID=W4FMB6_APHAT|nr:hypothetical protein H257_15413 [Aphanomyces astaci]ETV68600.1 hypothetical protein H257_15413 [Aphanomyces astaci]|eukprot:XP_009841825.1 hypothetical protein H257_15413 [Aphanomyces astaci]